MSASPVNLTDYEEYEARVADRALYFSQIISNISDPLEAIQGILENEAATLKTIWESDSGYPIDGTMIMIIMIPVVLGIIGHYAASHWEPMPTGEELYDDFGNRIVEYPKMPIAYLQQTRKDLSATRENRNSLAWLCHKWLISTNDVVQELQAPYPLERSTLRTIPEQKGGGKIIARMYEKLQQAALEWRIQQKKLKKEDLQKKQQLRKLARPLHTLPHRLVFRKAPDLDVIYLKRRTARAKRLWKKLNMWIAEYSRENYEPHDSDEKDSYWSSSETFSSDSGEHWKSYKEDAKRWAKAIKTTAQWKLEKGRKQEAAAAAEAIRRKKEAEAAAIAAEADDGQSQGATGSANTKTNSNKTNSQNTPSSKRKSNIVKPPPMTITVEKVGHTPKTKGSEKAKKQSSEASKIGEKKIGKR